MGPFFGAFPPGDRACADRLSSEKTAQVFGQLLRVGVSSRRFFVETFETNRFEITRDSWLKPARRDRVGVQHLEDGIERRGGLERWAARQ
jgi:hypothetical protein